MKRFFAILVLLTVCLAVASAADLVTATITVTNNPAGNTNTATINGSTRTVTNSISASPGTLVMETNTAARFATNLINHLTVYRPSGVFFLTQSSPTNVVLRGNVGGALVVSIAGGWAAVTYSTQQVTSPTFVVRMPITAEAETNQTNIASYLVQALNKSTSAIETNAPAGSNYITRGASPVQEAISPVLFSGGLRGSNVRLTNGFTVATTNVNPVSSNLVNYGSAIRSEGSGGNSLQVGSNAVAAGALSMALGNGSVASNTTTLAIGTEAKATNNYAMAVGNGAVAGGDDALAMGRGAQALGLGALAFGQGAIAQGDVAMALQSEVVGDSSIGIGPYSSVSANESTALGYSATVVHDRSTALGAGATTTRTNQVRLGTSIETVSVPGMLEAATSTNNTFTGTNHVSGDLSFGRFSNTSMINGNNSGILIGTNVIVELSGATTIAQYAGLLASRDGDMRVIRMSGPVTNIVVDANDPIYSPDGTAANRIVTGTGGALILTNRPSWMRVIYRAASTVWEVESHSR